MSEKLKVLVVGVGGMGASHAKGYAELPGYEIAGFVVAGNVERARKLAGKLGIGVPVYTDYYQAMAETRPEVVSINTYPNTHAEFSIHAMRQGCHVFMEKPMARTVEEAEEVARVVGETGRKLVIGYILRVHPAWVKFIELAQTLGKPLIMRMNLNQQSYAHEWEVHKTFIANMPPLVDCGVHYVDVMCQMTRSKPKIVQGIAARVSEEIDPDKHNYGALQVVFDDGSVGWYEVGWGPMMSKVAFFVKDVIGPKGCVSIEKDLAGVDPSDVSKHVTVNSIILHSSETDAEGRQAKADQIIDIEDEPDHDELCKREQEVLYRAITEDIDLSDHLEDAVNSLKICFAAVESYKTGQAVHLR
ncbi:MAG: Gfo/Idh/MocA family oxidoreductase [Spirochaetales bacterium]|nr:Gfo/Idh/MocA family oxidoreductase [Spirochaetales bacterium]